MEKSLKDEIRKIAHNTFEVTCYMFALDEMEIDEDPFIIDHSSEVVVSSLVTFKGAAEGGMVISADEELFDAIAANMLGVDEATYEEKEGALCEIANIVCGNTVPLFAKNGEICIINPPKIKKNGELHSDGFEQFYEETFHVYLDEGVAYISIFYKRSEL